MAILDGKALGRRIRKDLKGECAAFVAETGVVPCLATVLVGDDPASAVYVASKHRACRRIGFDARHHELPATATQDDVLAVVRALNADPAVHGILVQLPLPRGLDESAVIDAIDPGKDVDGLHVVSAGRLAVKRPGFVPCTPKGVMRLIEESGLPTSGKQAVVLGRSRLVGLPISLLLMHANATVTTTHSRTPPEALEAAVRRADIVVAAIGRPEFLPGEWIKPGAVVIDVGINRVDAPERGEGKTRLVGDVEFETAKEVAGAITPVPGGVGPMTIACLLANTVTACCRANGLDEPQGLTA